MKIRRALFTVSDKEGIGALALAMQETGTEIVATGKTAEVLQAAGVKVIDIQQITGNPEAFGGRMKTLSFEVCSGILFRRGNAQDEADVIKLGIKPFDAVVVNFYPFEKAAANPEATLEQLIEQVDIGGPTLVRAAAKNAPDTLVLTDSSLYGRVIEELQATQGFSAALALQAAKNAWRLVSHYDQAIEERLALDSRTLRYGENPHQQSKLLITSEDPAIDWRTKLTPTEISYNNILDVTSAYQVAGDLLDLPGSGTAVVILKHNNPCGVAWVPVSGANATSLEHAQLRALELAWAGDPVSAFGGVLVFTHALMPASAAFLGERFVELVAAPGIAVDSEVLKQLLTKRKNLKALNIRRFHEVPRESRMPVPGGVLIQTTDRGFLEKFNSVTAVPFEHSREKLAQFGIAIVRSLKSNAVCMVHEKEGTLMLVGTGQGQPNRIEAIEKLCIPRARAVCEEMGYLIEDTILLSDAFFPFADGIESCAAAGIKTVIQPGGSIKDKEVIAAANQAGVAMAFTGVRHFRH